MNNLHRELAPISDAAWAQIEEETSRTLKRYLAGRRVVDVKGPGGTALSAVGHSDHALDLYGHSLIVGEGGRQRAIAETLVGAVGHEPQGPRPTDLLPGVTPVLELLRLSAQRATSPRLALVVDRPAASRRPALSSTKQHVCLSCAEDVPARRRTATRPSVGGSSAKHKRGCTTTL